MIKDQCFGEMPEGLFPAQGEMLQNEAVEHLPSEHPEDNIEPCMKVFKSIDKLYAHLLVHTNDYPYECPIDGCKKRFR